MIGSPSVFRIESETEFTVGMVFLTNEEFDRDLSFTSPLEEFFLGGMVERSESASKSLSISTKVE